MVHTLLSRYIGFAAIGCGLIATVIYVLMITVTLAHIETISGQVSFDMRPFGYGPSDAATLLEAFRCRRARVLSQPPDSSGYPLSGLACTHTEQHRLLVWATHAQQDNCTSWRYFRRGQCAFRLCREPRDRGDELRLARCVGINGLRRQHSDNRQVRHDNSGCASRTCNRANLGSPAQSGRCCLDQ